MGLEGGVVGSAIDMQKMMHNPQIWPTYGSEGDVGESRSGGRMCCCKAARDYDYRQVLLTMFNNHLGILWRLHSARIG